MNRELQDLKARSRRALNEARVAAGLKPKEAVISNPPQTRERRSHRHPSA